MNFGLIEKNGLVSCDSFKLGNLKTGGILE